MQIRDEIRNLDEQYSITPNAELAKKRLILQSKHELLMTGIVEKQLKQSKQHFFEYGEKAGKLLAQARVANTCNFISHICTEKGDIVTDPALINKTFQNYYINLYRSERKSFSFNLLDDLMFPNIDS